MTRVLPAIIPRNREQLEEEIKKVSRFANLVQVDISDGEFTSVKTWPYNGQDKPYFDDLKNEKVGWPEWERVDIELHLMVKNPEEVVSDWIKTGIYSVVAHIEATDNFQKIIDICREKSITIGLAIKPSTDISKIDPFVTQVDFVQVMGSDLLGKHGVALEDKAVEKIKSLRERFPNTIISIDIGVTTETAEELVSAGASKLISGSAILNSDNPEEAWREISSF